MLTATNLVVAGVGISLVPASIREIRQQSIVYCPIKDAPSPASSPDFRATVRMRLPSTSTSPGEGAAPVPSQIIARRKSVLAIASSHRLLLRVHVTLGRRFPYTGLRAQ